MDWSTILARVASGEDEHTGPLLTEDRGGGFVRVTFLTSA
jgi:hypothetical protein